MISAGVPNASHSNLAILVGLLLIGFAMVGVSKGRAFLRFGSVDRQKEPVGFWLTIANTRKAFYRKESVRVISLFSVLVSTGRPLKRFSPATERQQREQPAYSGQSLR